MGYGSLGTVLAFPGTLVVLAVVLLLSALFIIYSIYNDTTCTWMQKGGAMRLSTASCLSTKVAVIASYLTACSSSSPKQPGQIQDVSRWSIAVVVSQMYLHQIEYSVVVQIVSFKAHIIFIIIHIKDKHIISIYVMIHKYGSSCTAQLLLVPQTACCWRTSFTLSDLME